MTIHFTSDTHFFHRKMQEFRGFTDIDTMHRAMITAWNSVVKPSDTVYHLGDLSFARPADTAEVLWHLNGQIRLVPGNHDDRKQLGQLTELIFTNSGMSPTAWGRRPKFVVENQLTEIKLRDAKDVTHHAVLCHFPLLVWNRAHYGAIHLHGHSHGNCRYPDNNKRFDVGVDAVGYVPLSADYILQWSLARGFTPHDQHEEKLHGEHTDHVQDAA